MLTDAVCSLKECVLCMACVNVCSKDAIYISRDINGFERITINNDRCVNCGLCENVCSHRSEVPRNRPKICYAAQAKDRNLLNYSASGGAFQMIAKIILERGGVCYGCMFENTGSHFVAKHIRIDANEKLPLILSTKYIPSIIGKTFQEAKKDLDTGKIVLFSGTPCQIQGLLAFLGKTYDNLLTVDLICHGIASTYLFNDYIKQVESNNKIKIVDYTFRDKSISWGTNFSYSYQKTNDSNNRKHIKHCPREESSYTSLYLQSKILRENCYSCEFSNTNRVSDFTLGDFWGIEKEYPEIITKCKPRIILRSGVSCILLNTEKACDFILSLNDKMIMHEVTLDSISSNNGNLRNPSHCDNGRDQLLKIYRESGYDAIERTYRKTIEKKRIFYNAKNFIKTYLPDRVRVFIYRSLILRHIVFR